MQALENWRFLSSDGHVAGALLTILKQLGEGADAIAKLIGLIS
ncbi:hypothetical protein [Corynebacterium pseudogenitalium]|nr:hypothetical protein [Corynebacterium pseudogenitalium]